MTPISAIRGAARGLTSDRPLLALLVVAGALRLAWGLWAATQAPETWVTAGDQYSYWYYGREIAAGDGYVGYTTGEPTAYYPVGYPALLALVFSIVDRTPVPGGDADVVAVVHALLGTFTVWCTYLVGRAAIGRRGGLVAAGLVALWPNLILYTPTFALETTFVAAATASLAVAATHDWASGPPSLRRVAAFGLTLGISAMVRPFSLPFVLGLALAVAATGAGWRTSARLTAVATAMALLVLVPWTIRNAVRLDAFVPISTNLGDTACLDRSTDADGRFAFAAHEWCADPRLGEVERSRENLALAIEFVREHPGTEVRLMWQRLVRLLEHDHSGLEETEGVRGGEPFLDDSVRRAVATAADAYFAAVLIAAAVGLALLARDWPRRPAGVLVAVAALVLLAIPVGLWGNPRFHVPLAPLAAVAAARMVVKP